MEIKRLREFRCVVEAGSLTRAAGLMHLTPGAMSKAMQQLEDELGHDLFQKRGRRLHLTDRGAQLYHLSAGLLEEHRRVVEALDASEPTEAPLLRIASFEVFTTHALGALDVQLACGPRGALDLQVLELAVGAIEEAVAREEADVGITYVPAPRPDVTFTTVGQIEFATFTRRGAFASEPTQALPFAIPTNRIQLAASDILGIDSWPVERVARSVRFRLTSLESALELCRRGRCAVFLPTFLVGLHNATVPARLRLVRRRSPPKLGVVRRDVVLVARDHPRDPSLIEQTHRALAAVLAKGVRLL